MWNDRSVYARIRICRSVRPEGEPADKIDTRRGGPAPLRPSERECLLWLARGLGNDRIAERIGLKPVTVGLHISNTCGKPHARARAQALVKAIRFVLVKP